MPKSEQGRGWLKQVISTTKQELSQLPRSLRGPARSEVLEQQRIRSSGRTAPSLPDRQDTRRR